MRIYYLIAGIKQLHYLKFKRKQYPNMNIMLSLNPFKLEFTIAYKPRIAAAILDL